MLWGEEAFPPGLDGRAVPKSLPTRLQRYPHVVEVAGLFLGVTPLGRSDGATAAAEFPAVVAGLAFVRCRWAQLGFLPTVVVVLGAAAVTEDDVLREVVAAAAKILQKRYHAVHRPKIKEVNRDDDDSSGENTTPETLWSLSIHTQ